jgi:hypothetical protein
MSNWTTTEHPRRFIVGEGARLPTEQEAAGLKHWQRQQNILILSVIDPLFLSYPSRSLVTSSRTRRVAMYTVCYTCRHFLGVA